MTVKTELREIDLSYTGSWQVHCCFFAGIPFIWSFYNSDVERWNKATKCML